MKASSHDALNNSNNESESHPTTKARCATQIITASPAHRERKNIFSRFAHFLFSSSSSSNNALKRPTDNNQKQGDDLNKRRSCSVGNLVEASRNESANRRSKPPSKKKTDRARESSDSSKWAHEEGKSIDSVQPQGAFYSMENIASELNDRVLLESAPNSNASHEELENTAGSTVQSARPVKGSQNFGAELAKKLERRAAGGNQHDSTDGGVSSTQSHPAPAPQPAHGNSLDRPRPPPPAAKPGGFRLPSPGGSAGAVPFNPFAPPGSSFPGVLKKPQHDPTGNGGEAHQAAVNLAVPLDPKKAVKNSEDFDIAKMRINALAPRRGARGTRARPMTMAAPSSNAQNNLSSLQRDSDADAAFLLSKLIGVPEDAEAAAVSSPSSSSHIKSAPLTETEEATPGGTKKKSSITGFFFSKKEKKTLSKTSKDSKISVDPGEPPTSPPVASPSQLEEGGFTPPPLDSLPVLPPEDDAISHEEISEQPDSAEDGESRNSPNPAENDDEHKPSSDNSEHVTEHANSTCEHSDSLAGTDDRPTAEES